MPSQIMPTVNLLKLPDPAAQTAKYVNMMNATRQQEASQRQANIAQEQLVLDKNRDVREADLQAANLTEKGQAAKESNMKRLRDLSVVVLNTQDPNTREAAYQNLLGLIDKTDDQLSAMMRQVAPTFNADILESAIMNVDTYFAKKYPNATASVDYTAKGGKDAQGNPVPENIPVQITTGRYPSTKVIRNAPEAAASTPVPTAAPPQTTPGPIPVGKYGETRVAPDGGQLDAFQQDHVRRMKEGLGMTDTPASFTRGGMATPTAGQMSPDMVPAIIDSAMKTGVMAQIDLDQMLALAPPQARQGIMDVIRTNKIALQADAPSLAASGMGQQPMAANPVGRQQSQFAVMRGQTPQASFADLGGQPQMQNTMAQYQPVQRRDPDFSPIPGSARVAPQVLGSQKAAETAGSENVKVGTEPRIVAGVERSKRLEKLRGEMPIAQAETQTLVNNLTGRINAIDEYLRSGSRNSIIGTVEGRIPKFFQSETRADAQGFYDYITSNTVLQKLIDDRGQTETGGSPQGVVSDADLKVAAQASTKLTQTGSERRQEIEMQRLRDELYRTRGQAIQKYNNVYREVIKEAPELGLKVRPVAPKYKSAPQTPTRAKSLKNIFGG